MTPLITLFFFLLPFQFALRPLAGVDLALLRPLALLLFFAWLFVALARRRVSLPSARVGALFVSVFFLVGLSLFSAENVSWGIRKFLFLFSFLPLFFVFADTFRTHVGSAETVLRALVVSATAAAFIALTQFFSQFVFGVASVVEFWRLSVLPIFLGPTFGSAAANYSSLLVNIHGATILRASAFFPDPHIASYFFGMTAACAIAFALHYRTFWWRLSAVTLLLADLLTFSRGGYIALLALGIVFLFATTRKSLSVSGQKRLFTSLSFGLIFFVLLIFFTPVGDRFRSSFLPNEGSNQGRIAMWQAGATAALTHPVTGVGLGNFPLFVKPSADYREPIYAHNIYLDISAEAGLLAGILFLALLLAAFFSLWSLRKQHPLLLGPSAGIALCATHSLVENPLFSVHILPILLLFLALGSMADDTKQ